MKILIATHNPGKLQELKKGLLTLENKNVQILSLMKFPIILAPQETGATFQENSLLKAQYYARKTGLPTIADDGGLGINILKGEPGIKSRRWPGYEATDEELIKHALAKLKSYHKKDRYAYLQTCITFYDPHTKKVISETEKIDGYIANVPSNKRTAGYPFRALFIVKRFNKYYDELTEKEHEKINHRLKAAKRLAEKIKSYLLQ